MSVVAAAPIGTTTYDANGDHHRRHCPCGAATADLMMMMAGKREGEATARRRRGDLEVTARQLQGKYKATMRQQGCEGISYGTAGGRGNEAIDKRKTNIVLFNI